MKTKNWEEEFVNKIMDWHYEVCSINFGADSYCQDATDLIDIVSDLLKAKEKEMEKELRSPMGCTQWKTTGLKYSYWSYFEEEVKKEIIKEIDNLKEQIGKETGTLKYDFCFDAVKSLIK
jgi:hypothetical protein